MMNSDLKSRIRKLENDMYLTVACENEAGTTYGNVVSVREIVYALLRESGLKYRPGTPPHFEKEKA